MSFCNLTNKHLVPGVKGHTLPTGALPGSYRFPGADTTGSMLHPSSRKGLLGDLTLPLRQGSSTLVLPTADQALHHRHVSAQLIEGYAHRAHPRASGHTAK